MIQMIFGCKSGKRAEYTLAVGVGAASRPRLAFNCALHSAPAPGVS